MAKKDDSVEKVTNKPKLTGLIKASQVVGSRIAEERGAFGSKIKKAIEEDHLDKFAFDIVTRLNKMDEAKASRHVRHLMIYIDHLGIGAQGDLMDQPGAQGSEDQQDEEEGDADQQEFDRDPVRRTVDATSTPEPDATLAKFKAGIADAPNATAVERGLARFVKDHPDLADRGHEVAQVRMGEIAAAPPSPGFKTKRKTIKPDAAAADKVVH